MKKWFSLFMVVLLLTNVCLLGYLISKQEGLFIEIKYISCVLESLEKDTNILKKALFYDKKKAKKLYNKWFKYLKEFQKEEK